MRLNANPSITHAQLNLAPFCTNLLAANVAPSRRLLVSAWRGRTRKRGFRDSWMALVSPRLLGLGVSEEGGTMMGFSSIFSWHEQAPGFFYGKEVRKIAHGENDRIRTYSTTMYDFFIFRIRVIATLLSV